MYKAILESPLIVIDSDLGNFFVLSPGEYELEKVANPYGSGRKSDSKNEQPWLIVKDTTKGMPINRWFAENDNKNIKLIKQESLK